MPAFLSIKESLSRKEFDRMVEASTFNEPLLKVDSSLSTIVKIFSSLKKGRSLCLLPQEMPEGKVEEISKKLMSHPVEGPFLLLLTSGTSGEAKIAKLSRESLFYSASHNHIQWDLTSESRLPLTLPLNHIAGIMILLRAHLHESTVLLDDWRSLKPTHLSLVPTQLFRLPELSDVKVLLGGAPISHSFCQRASARDVHLFPSYGMTEMCSQITTHSFSPLDTFLSLGHPLEGREIMVDETGEILVRGKTLFSGYLHEEVSPHQWFRTKDLGTYDEKGLQILGRKDRMFISGGENIHPEEIEKALLGHPAIEFASVKGTPDLEWGMKAIAQYKAKEPISSEELKEFLLTLLPSYKIPKEFIFSLTSSGKGMGSLV